MDEVDRGAPEKDEVTTMKKVIAWMMLAGMAGVVGLGGCTDDGPGQGKQEQEEGCALGAGACINNCNKKGLGAFCRACCRRRCSTCKAGGDYEFDSCFN